MSDIKKDSQKDVLNKQTNNVGIFSKFSDLLLNDYHTFLMRKAERLTSALYVITGFLNPEEPVRNRLRTCALDLIERSSHPQALTREGVEGFSARCSEIGAILQSAHSAGLISLMNAELLSTEYANLALFARNKSEDIRESKGESVKNDLFELEESYKTSTKGQKENKIVSVKFLNRQKRQIGKKGQNTRRASILELLNKKDKISIKDAVSLIPDCSEKTIQRELLSLVQDGLVLKEGERRWSMYRKAPSIAGPVTVAAS